MPKPKPFVIADALLEAYATNNRITLYLIENLDEGAWHADPPGGKGRTIGAVAAHIHNVRGRWWKSLSPGRSLDQRLSRRCLSRTRRSGRYWRRRWREMDESRVSSPTLPVSSAISSRMMPI